ncbi:hypothetical protein GBAR_LOCUS2282, partial [Geodia barretti]
MYIIHRLVTAMADWHKKRSISTVVCVEEEPREPDLEGPLDSTPASHRRKVSSQCLASLWRKMTVAHIQHLCVAHATIPSVSTAHHQSGPFSGWYMKQRAAVCNHFKTTRRGGR